MQFFIRLALILALVSASVSPACAFIAGKQQPVYIEICAADGSLQKVAVPAAFKALAEPDQHNQHPYQTLTDICDFCILHASLHQAINAAEPAIFIAVADAGVHFYSNQSSVRARPELAALSARAPPLPL